MNFLSLLIGFLLGGLSIVVFEIQFVRSLFDGIGGVFDGFFGI